MHEMKALALDIDKEMRKLVETRSAVRPSYPFR
jgi:hypothetical protein